MKLLILAVVVSSLVSCGRPMAQTGHLMASAQPAGREADRRVSVSLFATCFCRIPFVGSPRLEVCDTAFGKVQFKGPGPDGTEVVLDEVEVTVPQRLKCQDQGVRPDPHPELETFVSFKVVSSKALPSDCTHTVSLDPATDGTMSGNSNESVRSVTGPCN